MTKKEYEEAVQVIANFKAEIKLKDTQIEELKTEVQKYNTIAANLQRSIQKAYEQIEELEHTVSGLNEMWLEEKDKCVTCECAKFADKRIKPSKM